MIKKINEMPYIKYGNDKIFDLEFEKFNSDDMINYIDAILHEKKIKDKYGNIIQLKNKSEKKDFIFSMIDDKIFMNMVEKRMKPNEFKLLSMLFHTIIRG